MQSQMIFEYFVTWESLDQRPLVAREQRSTILNDFYLPGDVIGPSNPVSVSPSRNETRRSLLDQSEMEDVENDVTKPEEEDDDVVAGTPPAKKVASM